MKLRKLLHIQTEIVNSGKTLYKSSLLISNVEVDSGTYGFSPFTVKQAFEDNETVLTYYATYERNKSSDRWSTLQSIDCSKVCRSHGSTFIAQGDL